MKHHKLLTILATAAWAGFVFAKLPPPSDDAKAKAAEASAKAAEVAKKEAELLSKYQDLTAAKYGARLKAEGKEFKPWVAPAAPPAAAAVPAASAPGAAPAK